MVTRVEEREIVCILLSHVSTGSWRLSNISQQGTCDLETGLGLHSGAGAGEVIGKSGGGKR